MSAQTVHYSPVEEYQPPSAVSSEMWPTLDLGPEVPNGSSAPGSEMSQPVAETRTTAKLTGKLALADLAEVDDQGVAYLTTKAGRKRKLSEYGIAQITLHEEQIRKGLGQLLASRGVIKLDSRGRAHRADGSFMSNKELSDLAAVNTVPEHLFPVVEPKPLPEPGGLSAEALEPEAQAPGTSLAVSKVAIMATAATVITQPVPDKDTKESAPQGFLARSKAALRKRGQAVKVAYASAGNYLIAGRPVPTEEDLERHKRIGWLLIGAVGAVAVSRLVMQFHGFDHGGNGATAIDHSTQPSPKPSGGPTTLPPSGTDSGSPLPPYNVIEGGTLEPKDPNQLHQGIEILSKGQNPWSASVDYANSLNMPTNMSNQGDVQFIDAVKDRVLIINDISEIQATELPIDTRLKMPSSEFMAEMYEKYAKQ